MAFAASRIADRYQLLRPLGTGSLGEVIAGRDVLLGRQVAVKVLRPDLAADRVFMARFAREVKAAARLSHPNVVAVYDLGEHEGAPFVVTEMVEGSTLADLLASGDDLPTKEPDHLIGQVCSALAAAHAKGLVHGVLHPGNIMVGRQGRVKVTDFGVGIAAKQTGATGPEADLRAAVYASPEEVKGQPLDARSDLYSLGVCLYQCLTGEPPFTGTDPAAVAAAHAHRPPPPLRAERPDLPASLDAVMARALAKDPARRYRSAVDLREDLELAMAGRPLRHAATPPADQAGRPERPERAAPVAPVEPKVAALVPFEPAPAMAAAVFPAVAVAAAGAGPGPGAGQRVPTIPIQVPDSVIELVPMDEPERRSRTATLVLALPLLLVLLVGLALDQAGIGPFGHRKGPEAAAATMPTLTGTSADEARATLEQLGLPVEVVRRSHGEIPAGFVITTEPGPGSPIGPGEVVRLVVSSGRTQNPVPSVVAKPGPAAKDELVAAGFPCELRHVPSNQPDGIVLAQEPPAGNRLPPGRKVVLTVSGPDPGTGNGGTGTGGGTSGGGIGGVVPTTALPPGGGGGGRDPGGGGRDPDQGPGGGGPGSPGSSLPPPTEPPPTFPPATEPPVTEPPPTEPPPTSPPTTAGDGQNGRPVGGSLDALVDLALEIIPALSPT